MEEHVPMMQKISDEEYRKQVENLQVLYGYIQQTKPIELEQLIQRRSENRESNPLPEGLDLEDRFELEDIDKRFKEATKLYLKATQCDQMHQALWELRTRHEDDVFKMDDSLGIVSDDMAALDGLSERSLSLGTPWMGGDHALHQSLKQEHPIRRSVMSPSVRRRPCSAKASQEAHRRRIETLISYEKVDMDALKACVREKGVPKEHRTFVWQLLLNYMDPLYWNRGELLEKYRRHYYNLLNETFNDSMSYKEFKNFSIILLDSPRTRSFGFQSIYQLPIIRYSLERILYVWSSVHLDIGYFQGLNEIASILYTVFVESVLSGYGDIDQWMRCERVEETDLYRVLEASILYIEPDVFHCLERIMDNITSNYPAYEGGLFTEKMSEEVECIVKRENVELWNHLKIQDLTFYQFTFRWLLCLFIREFTTRNVVCIWDAYISEGREGFAKMHVFTTAAFILMQSKILSSTHNSEKLMGMLMSMPTMSFTNRDIRKMMMIANDLKARYHV